MIGLCFYSERSKTNSTKELTSLHSVVPEALAYYVLHTLI